VEEINMSIHFKTPDITLLNDDDKFMNDGSACQHGPR
jgi:hypothetical protein